MRELRPLARGRIKSYMHENRHTARRPLTSTSQGQVVIIAAQNPFGQSFVGSGRTSYRKTVMVQRHAATYGSCVLFGQCRTQRHRAVRGFLAPRQPRMVRQTCSGSSRGLEPMQGAFTRHPHLAASGCSAGGCGSPRGGGCPAKLRVCSAPEIQNPHYCSQRASTHPHVDRKLK